LLFLLYNQPPNRKMGAAVESLAASTTRPEEMFGCAGAMFLRPDRSLRRPGQRKRRIVMADTMEIFNERNRRTPMLTTTLGQLSLVRPSSAYGGPERFAPKTTHLKTLKAARAAGYQDLRPEHYGEDLVLIKSHVLIRNPMLAVSATEWKHRGYRVRRGEQPHGTVQGSYCNTWCVYREDQVEPDGRRRRTVPAPIDYQALYSAKYACGRDAIPDAAEALWLLNRHAKRLKKPERIYEIKNQYLKLLWELGYCVSACLATSPDKDLACWACDGTGGGDGDFDGFDDDDLDGFGEGYCRRCGGTGVYRTVSGREYWALVFVIGDRTYSWHQPLGSCDWAKPIGDPQPDHAVLAKVKSTRRFSVRAALALVEWVISGVSPESRE
jgi:hypothetical protein